MLISLRAVSIHAPWEGCDGVSLGFPPRLPSFNSRTLGRVRRLLILQLGMMKTFQFTHPGKGATQMTPLEVQLMQAFQFTHPGKGATSVPLLLLLSLECFNSRTLGRVRLKQMTPIEVQLMFQFTHPGKGATLNSSSVLVSLLVSIHAPWEGCDSVLCALVKMRYSFNSRTLGRVRLDMLGYGFEITLFQFTHPGKGATSGCNDLGDINLRFNSRTLGRVRLPYLTHIL